MQILRSLQLKCLPKRLRQVVLLWLFLRIRQKILEVAGAKTLLDLVTGKNVWPTNKKRAWVKLGRNVGYLQAIIRALRRCACRHHFKPNFLLFFKHNYEIGGFGWFSKRWNKDLKLRGQLLVCKKELVRDVIDITAYLVPYYGSNVLSRRLTTLRIVE